MKLPDSLRQSPLLAGLSEETLARLTRLAALCRYEAGQMILWEGEPCEAAFLIVEGTVRVYRLSPVGREQVLARLGPGQSFNTVPLFLEKSTNPATVEAVTPVMLYRIARRDLLRMIQEHPDLALALLREFAQRLAHLTDLVEDLALRTVRGRLARFLLTHVGEGKTARGWTQQEIAAHLGTVRDMVGRALRSFADAGLVRIERERIVLLDREGLEREAES